MSTGCPTKQNTAQLTFKIEERIVSEASGVPVFMLPDDLVARGAPFTVDLKIQVRDLG